MSIWNMVAEITSNASVIVTIISGQWYHLVVIIINPLTACVTK